MKNPSLDLLHVELARHIQLVQSYTEIEGLDFVIQSCRLKPYTYVFEERNKKLNLYRKWFDEYGNLLHVNNDRSIDITFNKISLKKESIISTDLYFGLGVEKFARISKMVHVCHGATELGKSFVFMTFLGVDNYLRCYFAYQNDWRQVSPLLLGLENLLRIGRHQNIQYFTHQESGKENSPLPCLSSQQWISPLPLTPQFISLLRKECETASNVLTGEFE